MNECTINKTKICYETRIKTMHTMKVIFDVVVSFFKSFFKFLDFKEFNKTIIPFAHVGYETHIQRALME